MMDVTRSQPAPASLARQVAYDGDDVKERLLRDFFGKCYLTEKPVGRGSFQIDHRKPKHDARFTELKFNWNNLFPADADANNRRMRNWPEGGLLDPAGGDRVERRVLQWLDDDYEPRFAAAAADDRAAFNTAAELDHLHNDSNPKAADLRDTIRRQLCRVMSKIIELDRARESHSSPNRLIELETEVRHMLSRRAPYTMLIRSKLRQFAEWFD